MKMKQRIEMVLVYCVLIVTSVLVVFPVFWAFLTSVKTRLEAMTLPPVFIFKPTLDAYHEVIKIFPAIHALRNSFILTSGSTAIAVIIGSLAAYTLSRFRFRRSEDLAFWILSIRMFPPIVAVIPIFLIFYNAGLTDTYLGMILVYTTFNLPLVVWIMRGFFDEIPTELDESAMVDGCSRLGAFWRTVLPLAMPGIVATAIFCVVFTWNELLFALVMTGRYTITLPPTIASVNPQFIIHWERISAFGNLALIPVVIFVMISQKRLIRGLTLGAVKK